MPSALGLQQVRRLSVWICQLIFILPFYIFWHISALPDEFISPSSCSSNGGGLLSGGQHEARAAQTHCKLHHSGSWEWLRYQRYCVSKICTYRSWFLLFSLKYRKKNKQSAVHVCSLISLLCLSSAFFRFITKAGRKLCVSHPDDRPWVKSHINYLKAKKTQVNKKKTLHFPFFCWALTTPKAFLHLLIFSHSILCEHHSTMSFNLKCFNLALAHHCTSFLQV